MVFSSHWAAACGAAQVQPVRLHRHQPGLHVPVAAELIPADLGIRAQHQVGPGGVGARRPAACAPAPQQGHAAEHAGLAGPGRGAAGRRPVLRRVPQGGQDVHAPRLQLRGLRVLVLVDHVLAEAFGHQLLRLGLHPGGHERGQVEPGVAVQGELVPHGLERRVGQQTVLRQPVPGHGEVQFADVDRVDLELVILLLDLPVQCHAAPSLTRSSLLRTSYPGPGGLIRLVDALLTSAPRSGRLPGRMSARTACQAGWGHAPSG